MIKEEMNIFGKDNDFLLSVAFIRTSKKKYPLYIINRGLKVKGRYD